LGEMLAVSQATRAPRLGPLPVSLGPPPLQLMETSTVSQAPSVPRLCPKPAPSDPPPFQLVDDLAPLVPQLGPFKGPVAPSDLELLDLVATPAVLHKEEFFSLNVCTYAARTVFCDQQPRLHEEQKWSGPLQRLLLPLEVGVVHDTGRSLSGVLAPFEVANSVVGELGNAFTSGSIPEYVLLGGAEAATVRNRKRKRCRVRD